MNQRRLGDHNAPLAKHVLSYPIGSTGLYHQKSDQENEVPLGYDCTTAFDQIPGAQIRRPPPVDLQYANPALRNYASLQDELYGNGPESDLKPSAGDLPPPVVRNKHFKSPVLPESPQLYRLSVVS
jgi:hypothetical protein